MALRFELKVVPSSGRNCWKLDKNGTLKCYLKSPAERNLANLELIKLLSSALKVPQEYIAIVSGQTDRKKRIKIDQPLTYEQLLAKLGIEIQSNLFS
jgi:uncharacterized protein YggU (UPF0235/DUF167 family)